jgi:hypothetical protein
VLCPTEQRAIVVLWASVGATCHAFDHHRHALTHAHAHGAEGEALLGVLELEGGGCRRGGGVKRGDARAAGGGKTAVCMDRWVNTSWGRGE